MRKKILLKGIISIILSVSLCVLIYGFFVRGGSLTPPPGAPGSTMFSLSEIAGTGFSSASHSLVQIKSNLDAAVSSRASDAKVGTATDSANMNTTLFAGQQYIWDNRASFGTAAGDATLANQTTILGRIGTNTDAASMSDTLFAGQQYIWDNRASFGLTTAETESSASGREVAFRYIPNQNSGCPTISGLTLRGAIGNDPNYGFGVVLSNCSYYYPCLCFYSDL